MSPPFRLFERAGLQIADKRVSAYRVTCSQCGVGATMTMNNMSGVLAPEAIANYFRKKGWFIGKAENHDLCPDHERRRVVHLPLPSPPPEKHQATAEDALVGTIFGCMRALEKALSEYAEIADAQRNDEVIAVVEAFKERIWGAAPPPAYVPPPSAKIQRRPWSEDELVWATEQVKELTYAELAVKMNRSEGALRQKMWARGVRVEAYKPRWTPEERATIARNIGVLSIRQIAKLLGRSTSGVRAVINQLKEQQANVQSVGEDEEVLG
jgi:hypothetical protein